MWLLLDSPALATVYVHAGDSFQDAVAAAADGETIQIDALTITDDVPQSIATHLTIVRARAKRTVLQLPDRGNSNPSLEVSVDVTFQDLTIDGRDATTLVWIK